MRTTGARARVGARRTLLVQRPSPRSHHTPSRCHSETHTHAGTTTRARAYDLRATLLRARVGATDVRTPNTHTLDQLFETAKATSFVGSHCGATTARSHPHPPPLSPSTTRGIPRLGSADLLPAQRRNGLAAAAPPFTRSRVEDRPWNSPLCGPDFLRSRIVGRHRPRPRHNRRQE